MAENYHIPVMPEESLAGLNLRPDSVVVDATFGGGGHSQLILQQFERGRLFAFDQDEDAAGNTIEEKGNHFIEVFQEALNLYFEEPSTWKSLQKAAKKERFTWKKSIDDYYKYLYQL